jgi:DNA repair protein RecN (Recombination protein N)
LLTELIISDFAIVNRLQLTFGAGFNVLTGETGAGKSIIIDAVNALLGERVDVDLIRTGASVARIEGIFELNETAWPAVAVAIEAEALEGDRPGMLILGREIRREGRHLCRINGRVVTLAVYRAISEHLVDIHGQGDHLSLFRVKQHVTVLDRYGGLLELRRQLAETVKRLREVRRDLRRLYQDERETARRVDLLQYQVEEIDSARLQPGEEDALKSERNRLANAEHLIELATEAYRALAEADEGQLSAIDLIGNAVRDMAHLERIDAALSDARQTAEEVQSQIEELARTLRTYCDDVEYNPGRLEEVEERLELVSSLKRKYGESIEEIIRFAEHAAQELDVISHSTERAEALGHEADRLVAEAATLAADLSARRREAGDRLAAEIVHELADLRMERAQFDVGIAHEEAADGLPAKNPAGAVHYAFDDTGYDQVEFLIAPNVGEPLKPLVKTASGGEASRLMLALKVVLSAVDPVPTLIFDEIDSGIGGRAGGVVGRKLWSLAADHQVLCVTHLPQIAAFADAHYRVAKQVVDGRTITEVSCLQEDETVGELAQMLGSDTDMAWRNAKEMREQVAAQKAHATAQANRN